MKLVYLHATFECCAATCCNKVNQESDGQIDVFKMFLSSKQFQPFKNEFLLHPWRKHKYYCSRCSWMVSLLIKCLRVSWMGVLSAMEAAWIGTRCGVPTHCPHSISRAGTLLFLLSILGTSGSLLLEFLTSLTGQSRELTANWLWRIMVLQAPPFSSACPVPKETIGVFCLWPQCPSHLAQSLTAAHIYQAWKWSHSPKQMTPFSTYVTGIG